MGRMDLDVVSARGRRAIGLMVLAAAAVGLSGATFLHGGAKTSPSAVPPSRIAPSNPAALETRNSGTVAARSQPVTLPQAEAEARQAGTPLLKPGWLPFRSSPGNRPRQLRELRDPAGQLLSIVTVYYGSKGQTIAVTQQFQAGPLNQADLRGTVGTSPAPWSGSGGGLSLAWKTSGGRYVIVDSNGVTQEELQRVAASLA
ncbi:MAG: hypothetical protein DLM67_11090 [Candidatus Nephthysia bennettiae]|nr:MAG: hypothetical protein DLM67_11090 [Candidatus Dormibacteraeota bacterium]